MAPNRRAHLAELEPEDCQGVRVLVVLVGTNLGAVGGIAAADQRRTVIIGVSREVSRGVIGEGAFNQRWAVIILQSNRTAVGKHMQVDTR
jgi:hypothetical protein